MNNQVKSVRFVIKGFPILSIIFALIAYFVYGYSFIAAGAIFLISLAIGFIATLGFIPVFGVVLYILLANKFILFVLSSAGIEATVLTGVIFLMGLIGSILYTIITLLFFLIVILSFRS